MGIEVTVFDPTNTILREIADPALSQKTVTLTYALLLKQMNEVDWSRVNRAIVDRWGAKALDRIKKSAWSGKCWKEAQPHD